MQWLSNNNIPELGQQIKYKDQNGIIHHGIFNADAESWHVQDVIGSQITSWRNVVEWQGNTPVLVDVVYCDYLVRAIESELG